MSAEPISLHDAADRMGVHYMTVYRYVRLGLLEAHKHGGSWYVEPAALARFQQPAKGRGGRKDAPWAERLETRLLAGDLNGSWAVIESALASGKEPAEVYVEMLAPALDSIGRRWEQGDIEIQDEHVGTAIANRLIGRLGSRFNRRGRSRGTVVTVMPSGERHGLGISMLSDVLRGAGYEVVDLGPDTPVHSLIGSFRRVDDLVAVCIGVVMPEHLGLAGEMARAVREALPHDVVILLGGRAMKSEDHARELGADGYAADPVAATEQIELLRGERTLLMGIDPASRP